MEYPYQLGIEMPEKIRHRFETEEHEYLVACINEYDTGMIDLYVVKNGYGVAGNYYHDTDIIGFVDLTAGKKNRGRGRMLWVTFYYDPFWNKDKIEEMQAIKERVKEQFRPGVIYRVKGYPPVSLPDERPFNNEFHMQGFYLTEVLEEGVQDTYLQNLLDFYYTKVTVHSDVFGEMALDKELMWYEAEMTWRRKPVPVHIHVNDEKDDISEALAALEAFWNKKTQWDKKYRAFAAKKLLAAANEQQQNAADDDKPPKVYDADSFAKALSVESVEIRNGKISVFYDDGGMFFGHAVQVTGTLADGAQSATISG